jgi:hypothetical protein
LDVPSVFTVEVGTMRDTIVALMVVTLTFGGAYSALASVTVEPVNVCEATTARDWIGTGEQGPARLIASGSPGIQPDSGLPLWLDYFTPLFPAPPVSATVILRSTQPGSSPFTLKRQQIQILQGQSGPAVGERKAEIQLSSVNVLFTDSQLEFVFSVSFLLTGSAAR